MRTDITGIAGWQKNSFIDFPGTVSTVLFFSGCNLRCPYCHNPGIVNAQPTDFLPSEDIWNFLEKRRGIVEGIVLSGGEPTLHQCCADVAREIRALGYKIKLDTNGLLPDTIADIAPDYLALDIKTIPGNYTKFLKAPYINVPDRLMASIATAKAMGDNAEIRITIAPGLITSEIIEELALLLRGVHTLWLQPMKANTAMLDPAIKNKKNASMEEIIEYQSILKSSVTTCRIRNGNEPSLRDFV
jgi:pyruvate formate lyase activating enzyme